MVPGLMLAALAFAGAPLHEPVGSVVVLDSTAPALPAADRQRVESRMEAVLEAGDVPTASVAARSAARACETQLCLQRTANSHGITHWLRSEITGDDREYQVVVTAGRIGHTTPFARSAVGCTICGMDDLAAAVESQTLVVRAELSGTPVREKPSARDSWQRMEGSQPLRDRTKGAPLRPTGIALLALGSASLVGGAVLMGIDGQDVRRRCDGGGSSTIDADGDCRFVHETRGGGIAMLTGGALAVAGGITLVSIEKHRRRAHIRARLGYNRIVIVGKF